MPDFADIVRYLHVIGATILLGTGIGIAFFMVLANRTIDARVVAHVSASVVKADLIFTATAVLLQPVTGLILSRHAGWPILEGWVFVSILLYVFVGLFWLPVVAIQIKMRNLAVEAARQNAKLPLAYHKLYRIWFAFGFPAFFTVLAIIWLMLFKPEISFGI